MNPVNEQFIRTALVLGQAAVERLGQARIAVFGIGGVGGHVVEALARSGIGALDLIDNDRVSVSNLNRQIIALHSTVGQYKVDAAAARIADINPDCRVRTYRTFFLPETSDAFDFSLYDYVVDAIDTVSGKIGIVMKAKEAGVPVISSMGAGNKTDASAFRTADIYDTKVCPLARVMRRELKARGIRSLKCVYSEEPPMEPDSEAVKACIEMEGPSGKRRAVPGSLAFVPAAAGLIIAGEVVRDLTGVYRHG